MRRRGQQKVAGQGSVLLGIGEEEKVTVRGVGGGREVSVQKS